MAVNYYSNPTSYDAYQSAVSAGSQDWYSLFTISHFISAMKAIDFSTQAGRDVGLGLLTSLVPSAPFRITGDSTAIAGDIRFGTLDNSGAPLNAARLFISAYCDGWPDIFARYMNSLNYRNRSAEKTLLSNGTEPVQSISTPEPAQVYSNYADASQAFRWATTDAQMLVRNRIGQYSFSSFEAKYGLIWGATPQNPIETLAAHTSPASED